MKNKKNKLGTKTFKDWWDWTHSNEIMEANAIYRFINTLNPNTYIYIKSTLNYDIPVKNIKGQYYKFVSQEEWFNELILEEKRDVIWDMNND